MGHGYSRTWELLEILEPLFHCSNLHCILILEVLELFSYRFLDFPGIPSVFLNNSKIEDSYRWVLSSNDNICTFLKLWSLVRISHRSKNFGFNCWAMPIIITSTAIFATYRVKVEQIILQMKIVDRYFERKEWFSAAPVPAFWQRFCENRGRENLVLDSRSFKAYFKLHRLVFIWLDLKLTSLSTWWILEYILRVERKRALKRTTPKKFTRSPMKKEKFLSRNKSFCQHGRLTVHGYIIEMGQCYARCVRKGPIYQIRPQHLFRVAVQISG